MNCFIDLITKDLVLCALVIFFSVTALIYPCFASVNLALNKKYSISPAPNYSGAALSSDRTALTDGKYTTDHFWTSKTTVGWQAQDNIEILIDLEKVQNIGDIIFSTARAESADVYYPAHIYAFVGIDKEHFLYVGDISSSKNNVPGNYQTKRFTLENIGTKGRYLLLKIAPKGYYLFCDEIEVTEGAQKSGNLGALTIGAASEYTKKLQKVDREKTLLIGLIDKLRGDTSGGKALDIHLRNFGEKLASSHEAPNDFRAIETDILRLRSDKLRAVFPGKRLLIEPVAAWSKLSPVSLPISGTPGNLSLFMPQGGYDHGTFLITNLTDKNMHLSISSDSKPKDIAALSLHHVPFVKSASLLKNAEMKFVADPLVPINTGITLRSGESRMVIVTGYGKTYGTWKSAINIAESGTTVSIPILLEVSSVKLPVNFTLNTVNWGYLDSKYIVNNKKEAVQDLLAHHVNVVVVPHGQLPYADGLKPIDFSPLEAYLKLTGNASKVLLYMAYNWDEKRLTCTGKCKFMDDEWKVGFITWYAGVVKTAAKAGFSQGQLYLYPYDEMHGKDVGQFIAFATWARKEIAGIRLYATLESMDSLQAIPYLDIAQIINIDDRLNKVGLSKTELWLYDAKGPAKSLSPYSYYRLMPWKVFNLGYKGAGFWTYSSFDRWGEVQGAVWDDFMVKDDPYAVIYEGKGGTIDSSRRWEGWRMGVEDYELLIMYARAKGNEAAKALAKSVLEHPEDMTRADEVRRKILRKLSN